MPDTEDQEFDKSFEGFGEDPKPATTPVADPATPSATPSAATEPPKADPPKPAEEPKEEENKDEQAKPSEEPKTPETPTDKKPEEGVEPPKTPEAPPVPETPEEPKPLTEESLRSIINEVRTEERTSGQALEETTKEVLNAYYPDGLSNVLVDQASGKELKTPQDVVDVTNGEMTIDQAAQWLMNEQYKLDQELNKIRNDAKTIAETTVNFKRDSIAVLQKYEPLFKQYPQLQTKVFTKLMKQVKADEAKGVILSAPDVMEYYDDYLEPYQQAFEFATKQSATNPAPEPPTPPPVTPSADDRLDEGGDGGNTAPDDPNDFAQQVSKELAKGI